MRLHQVKPPKGARKSCKILGRGIGSGHGGSSGRGTKGQKARSGRKPRFGFEGGQMPLHRRVPKRGFTNVRRKEVAIVNLVQLNQFEENAEVTKEALIERGLVKKRGVKVKILGKGEIEMPLRVKVDAVSKGAQEKIKKAGGVCLNL
jgi:large subunit ribosomal protein L15